MSETENSIKIGKVSRLTGISQERLRMWEKRYGAIQPVRTETGRRIYSFEDVERLKLMKVLTDGGDFISRIADLSTAALNERVQATLSAGMPADITSNQDHQPTVLLVGPGIEEKFDAVIQSKFKLNITARLDDLSQLQQLGDNNDFDLLFLELNTLNRDTAIKLRQLAEQISFKHLFLIYRFASSATVQHLSQTNRTLIRGPINQPDLEGQLTRVLSAPLKTAETTDKTDGPAISKQIQPRKYDDKTLAKIAAISPSIECECPNHLADLLTDINAFELYSQECKDTDPQQAAIHAFLYQSAASARTILEQALTVVLEHEEIDF